MWAIFRCYPTSRCWAKSWWKALALNTRWPRAEWPWIYRTLYWRTWVRQTMCCRCCRECKARMVILRYLQRVRPKSTSTIRRFRMHGNWSNWNRLTSRVWTSSPRPVPNTMQRLVPSSASRLLDRRARVSVWSYTATWNIMRNGRHTTMPPWNIAGEDWRYLEMWWLTTVTTPRTTRYIQIPIPTAITSASTSMPPIVSGTQCLVVR